MAIEDDIVTALTYPERMMNGIDMKKTNTAGEGQNTYYEVFKRIVASAAHGNQAALSCLQFYLDGARDHNKRFARPQTWCYLFTPEPRVRSRTFVSWRSSVSRLALRSLLRFNKNWKKKSKATDRVWGFFFHSGCDDLQKLEKKKYTFSVFL